MTRIDFYVLEPGARDNRWSLACRLAEKAWQQGHRVLLHTDSPDEARHLDRLLWTFRDQGFVPHGLLGRADPALNPVLIGHGEAAEEHDVLVNLSAAVPPFFSRFARLAECVDDEPGARAASRTRFRYYRDHGYPLQTHPIG